jgi:hypothetical protein
MDIVERREREYPKKITIPSDLGYPRWAFRVFVRNPCGSPTVRFLRTRRAKLLRVPATTLKFRACLVTSCEVSMLREPIDSSLNLSGSNPVVANRARRY